MSGPPGGGGSGFGGGGNAPTFDCSKVSIKTNIISPDPAVLATIAVREELDVRLMTATGPLIAVTTTGVTLGAIFTKDPALLINCINSGYSYKATVLKITGGDVEILITNK